jgi:O-antigen biosynthesis protein
LPKHFCEMRGNKICFVTNEFHGLFKNGGIGTAITGLATTLASNGFDVTVVYTDCDASGPRERFESFHAVKERYRRRGIRLDYITAPAKLLNPFGDNRRCSYAIYHYLKDKDFDVVYFNECGGHPFYTVLAKRAGILKFNPLICVIAHGGHEWLHEINLVAWDRQFAILAFMERRALELADAVISPSCYLVNWMTDRGFKLPSHVFIEQNIVDVGQSSISTAEDMPAQSTKELVFFGRQEVRKGLKLFCDAIDRISTALLRAELKITFMGKFSTVESLHSGAYVLERSRHWHIPVQFRVSYGQEQALSHLIQSRALAVIPSLSENSPCVVSECLQLGIPFLATDVGGTAELVRERDRPHCLVPPSPEAVAQRLLECAEAGQRPGRMAVPQSATARHWIDFHAPFFSVPLADKQPRHAKRRPSRAGVAARQFTPGVNKSPLPGPEPLVSVCLVHFNNPVLVNQALESIVNQTYSNYEVIIVDDGSTDPEALLNLAKIETRQRRVSVRVERQRNLYLGAARNTGVRKSRGDYIIFVDDDNLLMPTSIEDFVRVAMLTTADIVTAVGYHFGGSIQPDPTRDGEIRFLPIGGCAEIGMLENCFGDATALVSRAAFNAIGGFHEEFGKAVEDWEFFAKATLKGLKMDVLPKPNFWYRVRADSMLMKSNILENARRINNLYKAYPISIISKVAEGLLDIDREQLYRLDYILRINDANAQDLIVQISQGDVNGRSSIQGFLDYIVKSGHSGALDFALNNNIEVMIKSQLRPQPWRNLTKILRRYAMARQRDPRGVLKLLDLKRWPGRIKVIMKAFE